MGACSFQATARGKTAKEAFQAAREQALWDYGHRGYTGTIAEKDSFVMAKGRLPSESVEDYEQRLYEVEFGGPKWEPGVSAIETRRRQSEYEDTIPAALHQDLTIYNDKWGPALCTPSDEPDEWVFMGYASS